jgi:Cytochrome b5-like Heme/Steroid binding domain/Bacterial Ig-like domain (group 2)
LSLLEKIMKRLLLLAALLSGSVVHAQTPTYTLADVALHATATDCWMVLNTTDIYDFSNYIAMHPGANAMVPYCGKDGTQAFNNVGHSAGAVRLEASYLVGTLVTASPNVSVALAPTNASTTVGGTLQFTPTVSNSTQGVAWTVAPANLGSISASGLFTATTAGGGTITATSLQDATKSASATVTVTAVTPPPTGTITVSLSPAAVSVNQGSRVRFRASLTNSTGGVTWTATGSIGTISSSGVLTAAQTAGTGMVTATSVDDPTKSASAQVTITATTCVPATPPRHREDD